MDSITIVIAPHVVAGMLGIWVTWSIVSFLMLCDWIRDNNNHKHYVAMSIAEGINLVLWLFATIIFILIWPW